jgi:hypothetical protein
MTPVPEVRQKYVNASAIEQCRNAFSTSMSSPACGGRSPAQRPSMLAQVQIDARPFTRRVADIPGIKNSKPTCGKHRIL